MSSSEHQESQKNLQKSSIRGESLAKGSSKALASNSSSGCESECLWKNWKWKLKCLIKTESEVVSNSSSKSESKKRKVKVYCRVDPRPSVSNWNGSGGCFPCFFCLRCFVLVDFYFAPEPASSKVSADQLKMDFRCHSHEKGFQFRFFSRFLIESESLRKNMIFASDES